MHILPVLDLQNGIAVHGIAGNRHQYRAVESCCCPTADPVDLIGAWQNLGLREIYVADLSAIGGGATDWELYAKLLGTGARLWIDAGPRDADRCAELLEFSRSHRFAQVIVGLENLDNDTILSHIAARCDGARITFSLDLYQGRLWNSSRAWSEVSPEAVVQRTVALGLGQVIVLDVASVGIHRGPTTMTLCRKLRAAHPALRIYAGGGVRDINDLRQLHRAGCDGALVATALHQGRIEREHLEIVAHW